MIREVWQLFCIRMPRNPSMTVHRVRRNGYPRRPERLEPRRLSKITPIRVTMVSPIHTHTNRWWRSILCVHVMFDSRVERCYYPDPVDE